MSLASAYPLGTPRRWTPPTSPRSSRAPTASAPRTRRASEGKWGLNRGLGMTCARRARRRAAPLGSELMRQRAETAYRLSPCFMCLTIIADCARGCCAAKQGARVLDLVSLCTSTHTAPLDPLCYFTAHTHMWVCLQQPSSATRISVRRWMPCLLRLRMPPRSCAAGATPPQRWVCTSESKNEARKSACDSSPLCVDS